MDKINFTNYKYVMIGLLVCSIIPAFLSFITINGTGISMFRLLRIANLDFLDMDSQFMLHRFVVAGILFIILPIVEAIVLFISDRVYTLIFGCASIVLNVLMGIIMMSRLLKTAQKIAVLLYVVDIRPFPIILWILLNVLAIAATVLVLLWYFRQDAQQNTYQKEEGLIIDGMFRNRRQKLQAAEFSGALLCVAGMFRDKAFALGRDETVSIGSTDADDIFITGAEEAETYCMASYDPAQGEYRVTPCAAGRVFLQSGQPLGKNRIYCVPRGCRIIIANQGNIFELA